MTRLINMRQLEYWLSVADEVAELKMIADDIKKLEINESWKYAFISMGFKNGWANLDLVQKRQIKNIVATDSKTVWFLISQGIEISLFVLEKLSIELDSEDERDRAVLLINRHKEAKDNDIEVILNDARNKITPILSL